jgi:hypothetical protein
MNHTISSTMRETLRVLAERGGEAVCLKGGFWTYPGCATNDRGSPIWYAGTNTIRALHERGLLVFRTGPRPFPTEGTITAAGLAAVGKAEPAATDGECPVETTAGVVRATADGLAALGAEPGVVDGSGRPNFGAMARALRSEARWVAELHVPDRTGQAKSDTATLNRLADEVERVGKHLGYLS